MFWVNSILIAVITGNFRPLALSVRRKPVIYWVDTDAIDLVTVGVLFIKIRLDSFEAQPIDVGQSRSSISRRTNLFFRRCYRSLLPKEADCRSYIMPVALACLVCSSGLCGLSIIGLLVTRRTSRWPNRMSLLLRVYLTSSINRQLSEYSVRSGWLYNRVIVSGHMTLVSADNSTY